ncbi:MAG: YbaB/EbfC family nucleoid-associated protein [Verrucomicrobiales bacterium]|jgi:DNA-binding YbaB/EbfC family protein|nr:YbaB/EbfC family nucleoid-associated protein [Verrucomicrobiales bacterium]
MNIAKMMKQAQQMQADMARIQQELAQKTFTATTGGGAVKAVANGEGELQSLTIAPELLKDADVDMLQDLIVSAVQEAGRTAKQTAQKEMGKLTAGLNIPGLGF